MIELLRNHPFFADKTIDSYSLLENQGYCNENYLLIADGVKYIVRKLLREDIDRVFEWQVHSLAFEEGVTAEPLFFDKLNGFMVFEFLEGEHKEKLDESDLQYLAKTLQSLHTIKIDAKPIELHITHQTEEVIQSFEVIDSFPKDYILCHNDLNPKNILWTEDVKFIDWEYAGVNDRYFDLACVCVEFEFDEEMQKVFLQTYFSDAYNLEKLEAYKVIYKTLYKEWFKAHFKDPL